MIARLSAGTVRHRRVLLGVSVLVAVAAGTAFVLAPQFDVAIGAAVFAVMIVGTVVGVVTGRGADRRPPAAFVVRGNAFATPRSGAVVDFVVGLIAFAGLGAGIAVTEIRSGAPVAGPVLALTAGAVVVAAVVVGSGRGLWRGVGLSLHPDGLRADKVGGTLTVPWQALAARQPVPDADARYGPLRLAYERPNLVTATGRIWQRREMSHEGGIDADFLAGAVQHYVAHPEHRAAIGTVPEHDRLRSVLGV
jgi:hypothetical protein